MQAWLSGELGHFGGNDSLRRVSVIQFGHDLAQWVRSSLASQRPRLIQEHLIQEENTDQILSDLAEHVTNPAAAI
jgi:hypothetical protein